MRMLTVTAGVALLILAAGPTFAADPRGGGGHPGGGHPGGGCGSSCGGGGHPGGGHPGGGHPGGGPRGGGNTNVNVNVNANANASASAGASARSALNARTYDVGGIRGGGGSYGAVYVGGGYGGDGGGYYGGGAVYGEVDESRICASAPFGYVVTGFGREGRRAPTCLGGGGGCRDAGDRGGRYGHSERRGCGGIRRGSYSAYEQSGSYESHESYEEYGDQQGGYGPGPDVGIGDYERGYIDGRNSCETCRPDDHGDAPYPPPYQPEPPRYEPPVPPAGPYRPHRPQPSHPRQSYSQEPGERG